jgi:hypothetical protein
MAPVSYMKIMKVSHDRINAYFLDTAHEEMTQKTLPQSTDRTLTISGEWRRRNYGWAFFFLTYQKKKKKKLCSNFKRCHS